jgi:hypothetical protein
MKNLILTLSVFLLIGCDNMTKDITSDTDFKGDRIGSLPFAAGIHKIKWYIVLRVVWQS